MSFFIAKTIRRLFAPRHELSMSWFVWRRLVSSLRQRGLRRSRESGAFLLGMRSGNSARIIDFVLYDDLDPQCLDTGIVRFDGRHFGALWEICRARGVSVVADVHVHPFGSEQSVSDQNHPMISSAGHIALILPNFADVSMTTKDIGIYRYLGAKKWYAVPRRLRSAFLLIGI
jgi:hypothetical protein